MTRAAKTVYYFAFYLYLVGVTLIFLPNLLLQTLLLPPTNEVWIKVTGLLTFNIGFYYHRNANNHTFLKSTIPTRILVFITFTAFALLKYVSPVLILFGTIDLSGALWTWYTLRK